jgi:hypothetical protein
MTTPTISNQAAIANIATLGVDKLIRKNFTEPSEMQLRISTVGKSAE